MRAKVVATTVKSTSTGATLAGGLAEPLARPTSVTARVFVVKRSKNPGLTTKRRAPSKVGRLAQFSAGATCAGRCT